MSINLPSQYLPDGAILIVVGNKLIVPNGSSLAYSVVPEEDHNMLKTIKHLLKTDVEFRERYETEIILEMLTNKQ